MENNLKTKIGLVIITLETRKGEILKQHISMLRLEKLEFLLSLGM